MPAARLARRIFPGAALLALGAAAWLCLRSEQRLFDAPRARADQAACAIAHRLAQRHQLYMLMTFDEPRPVEWVRRGRIQCSGTTVVPGHMGFARQFDGLASHIETDCYWGDLGPAYTLALRVKLAPAGQEQDIWFSSLQQRRTGFKLAHGRLLFHIPWPGTTQNLSYAFSSYDRFIHLAATVDGATGQARLYENGRLMASETVRLGSQPEQNMEFGKLRWSALTAPLRGCLDEAAAWRRVLSPTEIRTLAGSQTPLLTQLGGRSWRKWWLAEWQSAATSAWLKNLDRLNPSLHEGLLYNAAVPDVQLHLSLDDRRHFQCAHHASRLAGSRTASARAFRRIHVRFAGQTSEARLALAGADLAYPSARRPAFLLETPSRHLAEGSDLALLYPLESLPDLFAPGVRPSMTATSGFCRLTQDGRLLGLYGIESFERLNRLTEIGAQLADGPDSPFDWPFLFNNGGLGAAIRPPAARDLPETVRRLAVHDSRHPWSRREWAWRLKQAADASPAIATPSAFTILGSNPAPFYVVTQLDWSGLADPTASWTWTSSRPDLIATDGRVTRPDDHLPVVVRLNGCAPDGQARATLDFRVMPQTPALPALMLAVSRPIRPLRQVDFSAEYHPAGAMPAPLRMQGRSGTTGGIKHRGLASYLTSKPAKKSLALEFDQPHGWLGSPESRHLYLLNCHRDATHIRNRLAFDLFRAFGGPGQPRYAPEIQAVEVFVNGAYRGVFDLCTRIRAPLLGITAKPENPARAPCLFKISAPDSLFAHAGLEGIVQVSPAPEELNRTSALLALLRFTAETDSATFRRDIGRHFDLDNVVDFILLLNFTGNEDGRTTNFYLGRAPDDGSPFFFIPWDYDLTFGEHSHWLSNRLFDRLIHEVPDFRARLARRWTELRRGPLEAAALTARISAIAAPLRSHMDWDAAVRQAPAGWNYDTQVEQLIHRVQSHLAFMDERLGDAARATGSLTP